MSPSLRALALASTALVACPAAAQFETQKLTASDAQAFEEFGSAVALSESGDLAAVGIEKDELPMGATGSVRVFTRTLDAWIETAVITLDPGVATYFDDFGSSIAFSGDRLLAASPYGPTGPLSFAGRVRVFDLQAGGWTETGILFGSSGHSGDDFGATLSTSGSRLLVGAPRHEGKGPSSGAAFVFEQQGGSFVEVAELLPPGSGTQERFGSAVAISGTRALVASPNLGSAGVVRVYEEVGTGWVPTGRLDPSSISGYSDLGLAVALRGDRALVSASRPLPSTGTSQGLVFVFERAGGSWVETAVLTEPSGPPLAFFGRTVALTEGRAVIAAPDNHQGTSFPQGGVNVFEHQPDGTWEHEVAFAASDGILLDGIATEMAAVGDWILASAPLKGGSSGAAFLFSLGSIADPYGCGVNPDESLVLLDGSFGIGDDATLGIDNPLGTQSPGALPFAFFALAPDAAFPCGGAAPGLGMAGGGSPGELLIDPDASSLLTSIAGPAWTGPGTPAPIEASVPSEPSLLGLAIHVQGVLVDPEPGSAAPVGLTNGLRVTVGLD